MNYRNWIRNEVAEGERCLEIGPSYNPILPKAQGYRTTVFDHLNREQLRDKYKSHGVDINAIEDVDFIGSSLSDLEGKFDCIVGSHLLEHTPDMIGFLKDCSRLMHDKSRLFLIIPDKRRVFDALRPLSSTGNVIDAHILGRSRHVGAIFDTKINAASRNEKNNWGVRESSPIDHIHNFFEAKKFLLSALNSTGYIDAHAWCFTPDSFRLIAFDLVALSLIDLVEDRFHAGDGPEFYFVMRKGRVVEEVASRDRAALAKAALKVERDFSLGLANTHVNFRS